MASVTPYKDIKAVQVDALVILQIMNHCKQNSPQAVTGQLLGLDVDDGATCKLEVTHSFGYMQKGTEEAQQEDVEQEKYQKEMQGCLQLVQVDQNVVGWYQTTHLGQLFNNTMVESQYTMQSSFPCSIVLVYDPLQAAIGKPSFKALRLTQQFMARHADFQGAPTAASSDAMEMFVELPIYIHSPAIIEAFLVDWSLMDTSSTTQIEALDTENQVFLERNLDLLIKALMDLAEEQQKLQAFERQAGRQQPDKGKGRGYRNQASQPRQLDTMILSQQIQNYCKQINEFSSDSFGKLFLLSNKPASLQEGTTA